MTSGPGSLLADSAAAPDAATAMRAAVDALRAWVGVGPVFLAPADPASGEMTGSYRYDISADAAAAFFANEMAGSDVVGLRGLAEKQIPVGALFTTTGGRPERSPRWREIIEPLGWGDEMRAAVCAHGRTWAYLCLHRDAHDRPFSERDVRRLIELLPALASALRRVALIRRDDRNGVGSGVVLVGPNDRVLGMSGAAGLWLDEMNPVLPGGLPVSVAAIARRVFETHRPVTMMVTTPTSRRAALEAALLEGVAEPQVVVVINEASPVQSLNYVANASQLTRREREVVSAALQGMSTRTIARNMSISQYTVQAHLTAIFDKTGVRSRGELIAYLGV